MLKLGKNNKLTLPITMKRQNWTIKNIFRDIKNMQMGFLKDIQFWNA